MKPEIKRILVAIKPRERGLPLAAYHARFLAQALNAEIALLSCVVEGAFALALQSTAGTARRISRTCTAARSPSW